MWPLVLVPVGLVLHDYLKAPIDRLYFTNPRRPLVGMRNAVIDLLMSSSEYRVRDYPGLWLIKFHYEQIREEFMRISHTLEKQFFHDLDPWFDTNDTYYYYRVRDFPKLDAPIKQIPCVHEETALFAVLDGPIRIHLHRAETNLLLRYHITIQSDGDCTLYTEKGPHEHLEGQDFLFDHAKYHEVLKR